MKDFWDQRYSDDNYAYGTAPNAFFQEVVTDFHLEGNILLPAEGEGRNAVFAASTGLQVTAFDISQAGRRKAMQLAAVQQVSIQYLVGEFAALRFEEQSFDTIALIYAHFPAPVKSLYHRRLSQYLKPGGLMIFEAFGKKHLAYNRANPKAGGPKDVDMLFSADELLQDFSGFQVVRLSEETITLAEGQYHQGQAAVVRFVGRKACSDFGLNLL